MGIECICVRTEQSWSWRQRECCRGKHFFEYQSSFPTIGTAPGVLSGNAFEEILPGQPLFFLVSMMDPEKCHAPSQFVFSISAAQEAVVPDFDEPIWEDVEEKTANELGGL